MKTGLKTWKGWIAGFLKMFRFSKRFLMVNHSKSQTEYKMMSNLFNKIHYYLLLSLCIGSVVRATSSIIYI